MVEDTFLIAIDLADQLTDSGYQVVGPVSTVKHALETMDGAELDGALLDVNLDGERSFPIAEFLAARGIPFIFLTGYDSQTVFPDEFRHAPRLAKPVDTKSLLGATTAHFGHKSTGDRVRRSDCMATYPNHTASKLQSLVRLRGWMTGIHRKIAAQLADRHVSSWRDQGAPPASANGKRHHKAEIQS